MTNYVIASSKDWFRKKEKSKEFKHLKIYEISTKKELTSEFLESVKPRYVFFPHWNWIVPSEIYETYECVVFHTAPLPFGRGGSPIQNLIVSGIKTSPVCALRMTEVLDGGPIYDALDLSLEGTIAEIFERIASCVEQLILSICVNEPNPKDQLGEPTYFKRLNESDNELLSKYSLNDLYDRIRMVDGLDYLRAYINYGRYKLELTNAKQKNGELTAEVKFLNRN